MNCVKEPEQLLPAGWRQLCIAFCALALCSALAAIAARSRDHLRLRLLPVAGPAACWTKEGGRYMAAGGVLRCPVPTGAAAPQLADMSALSYVYSGALPAGTSPGARQVDNADSPLVLEGLNIIFCFIPKNSCSKFKQLFARVAGDPLWRDDVKVHHSPYVAKASALDDGRVNAMLADPRSVRAVLLRDPVERFLSAYADKIVAKRCRLLPALRGRCNYTLSVDDVARFTRDYPRWIMFDHMAPQVNFCGLKSATFDAKRLWNRIGYFEPGTIANVASRLFDGRLDGPMRHGWDGRPERGMWDEKTNHTLASRDAARFRQALCRNGTVLEALRRSYAEDYEFFIMPARDLCSHAAVAPS